MLPPLAILIVGVAVVLTLIVAFRLHAFIALITAAIVVSLLAPGDPLEKISRVAQAFGSTAGNIGILIAAAAIIGRCLIDSGAADRIVQAILKLFGIKRSPISLMSSGFVLSIPVFFDTVFYLLLPLARSMHRQTGINYLLLILCMGTGAGISHALVPPTPGPLLIADAFGIDIGVMMIAGAAFGAVTAAAVLPLIKWIASRNDIPMRAVAGESETEAAASGPDAALPGLGAAALPIALPVLLIAGNTAVTTLAGDAAAGSGLATLRQIMAVLGNPNFAMLLAAAAALAVLWRQKAGFSRDEMAKLVETSLASAGVIILITAAGGAFGGMLQTADVGAAITNLMAVGDDSSPSGIPLMLLAFAVASLIKFAQGSTTVAMITTSAMLAGLVTAGDIGFHPLYLACAVGFGAQCGNWMNDSGFWIFSKMSGLTEIETLRTWTVTVSSMAVVGFIIVLIVSQIMPLTG